MIKNNKFIFLFLIVFINVSCVQIGGKIFFQDDEWTQMHENAEKNNYLYWNEMLAEWDNKWRVNGLRVYMDIFAYHTVFSSKEPYYIRFSFMASPYLEFKDNNYVKYRIKDVKITGESGYDYQSIADRVFPYYGSFDPYAMSSSGRYNTGSFFPFTFEKLVISFTAEVETTESIESKTFERHLTPKKNPPVLGLFL